MGDRLVCPPTRPLFDLTFFNFRNGTLTLLTTMLLFGFASAQKVVQLAYCSVAENHLRMDCKYALPAESPEVLCKYTQGERLLDTTDPNEEQPTSFKNRAKVRLFPGNNCRLLFKNLPEGKSNFTCNIKQGESSTATKTSVVDKSKLPCWSLPLCSLLLTLMTLPLLLEIHGL
uniref:Thy-1 cell surface antigen n=1 Tax=Nothobranchius furzeri TaxID=105023 RepID=A0A8C6LHJ3_NOTFU